MIKITVIVILAIVFMFFVLREMFNRTPESEPTEPKSQSKRKRYVKDVKPGELVQIEWYRIATGIGYGKCINNDPDTSKILLEFTWNNYKQMKTQEKERVVFDYKDKELANFGLLNPDVVIPAKPKPQKPQSQPSGNTEQGDTEEKPPQPKSILKSVYCDYKGHLIVYDVHGKKVQELSGKMTLEKCKEIENRSQDGITEVEGSVDVYKRISEELKQGK